MYVVLRILDGCGCCMAAEELSWYTKRLRRRNSPVLLLLSIPTPLTSDAHDRNDLALFKLRIAGPGPCAAMPRHAAAVAQGSPTPSTKQSDKATINSTTRHKTPHTATCMSSPAESTMSCSPCAQPRPAACSDASRPDGLTRQRESFRIPANDNSRPVGGSVRSVVAIMFSCTQMSCISGSLWFMLIMGHTHHGPHPSRTTPITDHTHHGWWRPAAVCAVESTAA
jgi:hypothetical protein